MADARKTLDVLYNEWSNCTRCELGTRRNDVNGAFVFGEGVSRGILFVGAGPGKTEEEQGRPFIGKSGMILRSVLDKLNITEAYITNTVCCRSCSALIDQTTGLPMMRKNFKTKNMEPVWKDEPPTPIHVESCSSRLYEEIYINDPVVIVALGGGAAKALSGTNITITTDRGKERHITIPGATFRPVLTEKKGAWLRKVQGQLSAPVEQNEVRYLMIPTLHPAYVLRKLSDKGPTSPFRQFFADIKKAGQIYERYMAEAHNVTPLGNAFNDSDIDEYQAQLEGSDEQES